MDRKSLTFFTSRLLLLWTPEFSPPPCFALLILRDRHGLVLLIGSTLGPNLAGWFNRFPFFMKLVDVATDAKLASTSDPLHQRA